MGDIMTIDRNDAERFVRGSRISLSIATAAGYVGAAIHGLVSVGVQTGWSETLLVLLRSGGFALTVYLASLLISTGLVVVELLAAGVPGPATTPEGGPASTMGARASTPPVTPG
jgi:hypothetical protein